VYNLYNGGFSVDFATYCCRFAFKNALFYHVSSQSLVSCSPSWVGLDLRAFHQKGICFIACPSSLSVYPPHHILAFLGVLFDTSTPIPRSSSLSSHVGLSFRVPVVVSPILALLPLTLLFDTKPSSSLSFPLPPYCKNSCSIIV